MEIKMNVYSDLLYKIPKELHFAEDLSDLLKKHSEIKFVSFASVDLWGNDTDEKIPVSYFLKNIDELLANGIQTDGSSVALSDIATLDNARVDLIPDMDVNWYIDYNHENLDPVTKLPIGTLRIPSFLKHNNDFVDSRYILRDSLEKFKNKISKMLNTKEILDYYNITYTDIDSLEVMLGTELEFWVRTPNDSINEEKLVLSQAMKEQYWKRTKGVVRTALEKSLQMLELYGLNPEMGHKEVGGVSTYVAQDPTVNHIVEQLEIDWKYDRAIQTADNELLARIIIKEIFRMHGLEVSFLAKPIPEVAGSGEHFHISLMLKLKTGEVINLLEPNTEGKYLSKLGFGMIMGVLRNYEVINPLISATNDAFNRLKPGFEAPTHIIASIGQTPYSEIRNRTVLAGLLKDKDNPLSTRFEIRSPNPKTNTFLAVSGICAGMLDGINYTLMQNVTEEELEKEICKEYGEDAKYLEKDRVYREEKDVFRAYTEKERDKYFGVGPKTVYENVANLEEYKEKVSVLTLLISNKVINSYKKAAIRNWLLDLNQRVIPSNRDFIRLCIKVHDDNPYDNKLWEKINSLKENLAKDADERVSMFTTISNYTKDKKYKEISDLQIKMDEDMKKLQDLYDKYRDNQI